MDEREKAEEQEPDDLELPADAAEHVAGSGGTFDLTFKGQTTPGKDADASQWIRVSHPH